MKLLILIAALATRVVFAQPVLSVAQGQNLINMLETNTEVVRTLVDLNLVKAGQTFSLTGQYSDGAWTSQIVGSNLNEPLRVTFNGVATENPSAVTMVGVGSNGTGVTFSGLGSQTKPTIPFDGTFAPSSFVMEVNAADFRPWGILGQEVLFGALGGAGAGIILMVGFSDMLGAFDLQIPPVLPNPTPEDVLFALSTGQVRQASQNFQVINNELQTFTANSGNIAYASGMYASSGTSNSFAGTISAIPEPSGLLLMAIGLAAQLAYYKRRVKRPPSP